MENTNFKTGFKCADIYNYFDGVYSLDMIKRYQKAYQKAMRKFRYTIVRYGIKGELTQMFDFFSKHPSHDEVEKEIERMNNVNTPKIRLKEIENNGHNGHS